MRDSSYFESYGDLRVHKTMLTDEPRMRTYHDAIVKAREYFEDAVILDLGCGTGILSAWIARETKARRIIAIDGCAKMASSAKELAARNNLQIEVVHATVEEFRCDEPVDIIVSEWMGHYLLHEGMLESLIYARDHLLRRTSSDQAIISHGAGLPDLTVWKARETSGLLFPAGARIFGEISHVCASDLIDGINSELLYGVDISGIFASPIDSGEPLIRHIPKRPNWAKAEHLIAEYDLYSISGIENIHREFTTTFLTDGLANCYVLSFTCVFPGGMILDTRSGQPITHWKQTLIPFGGEYPVNANLSLNYQISITNVNTAARQFELNFEIV